jgi:tyrosyl-tRNA synthetase
MEVHDRAPERREAQRALAGAVTALVHGEEAAAEAQAASSGFTRASADLSADDLAALVDAIPTTHLGASRFDGLDLVDAAVETGIVASKSEARRMLDQSGLYVNDQPQSETRALGPADLLHGRFVMLRRGKKSRHLVVVEPGGTAPGEKA